MPRFRFALFSLTLLLCLFAQTAFSNDENPLPQCLIDHMTDRTMRYHHYLWHQVRADWLLFDAATKEAFSAIGWEAPNPSRDHQGQPINDNYCGEDFLYMHVHMLDHANKIIADCDPSYGVLESWERIPAPGDTVDPVPAPYANFKSAKTDEFYEEHIKSAEEKLRDPDQLRNMTLNELGLEIERGVHAAMHNRWSSESAVGYREGCSFKNGELPYVNKKWDEPSYNWLIDTYSAHVNPVFWKLHGWINERLEDWRKANGITKIKWNGTWTGGPMSTLEQALNEQEEQMNAQAYESEGRALQSGVPEIRFVGDL